MDISSLPVINAGFPSPAQSFFERRINTQDLLVPHPEWTFFATVDGDSMAGAGIHSGDIIVIDRSLDAEQHTIIVATLNESFVVKRIQYRNDQIILLSEHHNYPPIAIRSEHKFCIVGVVTWSLHRMDRHIRGSVVKAHSATPLLPQR